jgi:hypothetical protein
VHHFKTFYLPQYKKSLVKTTIHPSFETLKKNASKSLMFVKTKMLSLAC